MPILKHYLIYTPYSMWKTFLEKTCQKLHLHFFLQSLLTAIHMLVVSTSDGPWLSQFRRLIFCFYSIKGVNTWCNANSISFKSHSIRVTFKICAVLGAQGIRATGFRRAQGNQHCAKFESHTNRVTFETNAIRMTSSVQALRCHL